MDNIDMKTVGLQKSVVEKYNKSKIPHYIMKVAFPHGISIDYFWAMNGVVSARLKMAMEDMEPVSAVPVQFDHDAVMIMDIDAIPLSDEAIDYYFEQAYAGKLIGNAQRTNHIENDQHIFAAPSTACISKETYIKIGAPSAFETLRGDVLEEYTYAAEEHGIKVDLMFPLRYNESPIRYNWEKDQPPHWNLKDGQPVYGIGTTYGNDAEMFYHQFQIRMEGMQEKFWVECEKALQK